MFIHFQISLRYFLFKLQLIFTNFFFFQLLIIFSCIIMPFNNGIPHCIQHFFTNAFLSQDVDNSLSIQQFLPTLLLQSNCRALLLCQLSKVNKKHFCTVDIAELHNTVLYVEHSYGNNVRTCSTLYIQYIQLLFWSCMEADLNC